MSDSFLTNWLSENLPLDPGDNHDEANLVPPAFLEETKVMSAPMYISLDMLMDYGVIPDTREYEPMSVYWRIRFKISDFRYWLAVHACRLIVGYWPQDDERSYQ